MHGPEMWPHVTVHSKEPVSEPGVVIIIFPIAIGKGRDDHLLK